MLRRLWNRLQTTRQKHGFGAVVRLLIDRLCKRLIGLDVVHVMWLDRQALCEEPATELDCEFRFLRPAEVAHFQTDPETQLAPWLVERMTGDRERCFGGIHGGQLVTYSWYALDGIEQGLASPQSLSYPRHIAYMYNGFTRKSHRGLRLYGQGMGRAMQALSREGIEGWVSFIDWTNHPSLIAARRLGNVSLGRIVTVSLFGWSHAFYPRRPAALGIRMGQRAQPVSSAGQPRSEEPLPEEPPVAASAS